MNTSPGPPEHHYTKFQEWHSLNKGTPKQRKEPLSEKRKQSPTTVKSKRYIKPDCTKPIINNDDTNEKDNKIVKHKSVKKKTL